VPDLATLAGSHETEGYNFELPTRLVVCSNQVFISIREFGFGLPLGFVFPVNCFGRGLSLCATTAYMLKDSVGQGFHSVKPRKQADFKSKNFLPHLATASPSRSAKIVQSLRRRPFRTDVSASLIPHLPPPFFHHLKSPFPQTRTPHQTGGLPFWLPYQKVVDWRAHIFIVVDLSSQSFAARALIVFIYTERRILHLPAVPWTKEHYGSVSSSVKHRACGAIIRDISFSFLIVVCPLMLEYVIGFI